MNSGLYDVDLEERIISSCLFFPATCVNKMLKIPREAFSSARCAAASRVIECMVEEGVGVSLTSFRETAKMMNEWGTVESLFNTALETKGVWSDAEYWHRIVDLWKKRRIIEAAKDTYSICLDMSQNAESVGAKLCADVEEICHEEGGVSHVGEADPSSLSSSVIETGIDELDDKIVGLFGGQLIVIAARTRMGKSTLALQIAKNISRQTNVLFVSLEMSSVELQNRIIASATGLSALKIRAGRLDYAQKIDVENVRSAMRANYPGLFIDDSSYALRSILAKSRAMFSSKSGVLFIDYLQYVDSGTDEQRHLQIGTITRSLKRHARVLGIPVVALAQLNRTAEGQLPMLSDLRESGTIEQDADTVIFIHKDDPRDFKAKIIIAKSRDGGVGYIESYHDASRYEFKPIPESEINLEGGSYEDKRSASRGDAGPSLFFRQEEDRRA